VGASAGYSHAAELAEKGEREKRRGEAMCHGREHAASRAAAQAPLNSSALAALAVGDLVPLDERFPLVR
jgi:hypothetical protein